MYQALNELAAKFHELSKAKGWWGDPPKVPGDRNFGEILALIHSEVSEALEVYRTKHHPSTLWFDANGKPEGIPAEFADILIRVLETCAAYGIDIAAAVELKHEFNMTRPYRHGGKAA